MSSMTGEASCQWGGTATPTPVDPPSRFCWAQLPTWTNSTPSLGALFEAVKAMLAGTGLYWGCIMHYGTEVLCFLYVADAEHDSLWLCVWRL